MNWVVISNHSSSLQEYRLIDNTDCIVVIKFNPRHQSARITSGNHHRLFYFESAGSLSGKTIFKNEYDMEVGNLVQEKLHPNEGSLLLDTKKYHYQLHKDPSPQLFIFEKGQQEPQVACSLPASKTANQNLLSPGTQSIDNNCYFLGLCWYLSLALVKEKELKLASNDF